MIRNPIAKQKNVAMMYLIMVKIKDLTDKLNHRIVIFVNKRTTSYTHECHKEHIKVLMRMMHLMMYCIILNH